MDWNKISHGPRHRGVLSGVSITIFKPMVCSAKIMHLSCTDANTVSIRTEMRFHVNHVTKEFNQVRLKQFLSQWYVWRTPCTYLMSRLAQLQMHWIELPLKPRHLGVPSCASKMISKPMVHLVQTVHVSFTDTTTVSRRTEIRFYTTHITEEFYRVCP
jgi:hypothetical protein